MKLDIMQFFPTSCHFSPDIPLSILFSNILSLLFFNFRDQISFTFETIGKIITLLNNTFLEIIFLGSTLLCIFVRT
jgi:hypothetical protein